MVMNWKNKVAGTSCCNELSLQRGWPPLLRWHLCSREPAEVSSDIWPGWRAMLQLHRLRQTANNEMKPNGLKHKRHAYSVVALCALKLFFLVLSRFVYKMYFLSKLLDTDGHCICTVCLLFYLNITRKKLLALPWRIFYYFPFITS